MTEFQSTSWRQENGGSTEDVELRRAAIGSVEGKEVEIEQSSVRSVVVDEFEAEQSAIAFVRAREVSIEGAAAGVIIARTVEAEELRAAVVIAPSIRGNVRTLFDLRTAFAIGAGFFLARWAMSALSGALGSVRSRTLR